MTNDLRTWIKEITALDETELSHIDGALSAYTITDIDNLYNHADKLLRAYGNLLEFKALHKLFDKDYKIKINSALQAIGIDGLNARKARNLTSSAEGLMVLRVLIDYSINATETELDALESDLVRLVGNSLAKKLLSVDGLNRLSKIQYIQRRLKY